MAGKASSGTIFLRVYVAPEISIGPGKADLLEGIRSTGSIAAAGRQLGMSYKRAWHLIEALNGHFAAPLVVSSKGGASGGGATLTELGLEVLQLYREMQLAAEKAIAPSLRKLRRRSVLDMSVRK